MRLVLFLLLTAFSTSQSLAWEVIGADDPNFIETIDAWLADEERSNCTLLQLVDADNAAAAWFVKGLDPEDRKCGDPEVTTPIIVSKRLEETAALEPAFERLLTDELERIEQVELLLNLGEPRRAFEHLFEAFRIDNTQYDDPPEAPNLLNALSPPNEQWLDPELKLFLLIYSSNAAFANTITDETWQYWLETACLDNRLLDNPFRPLSLFCAASPSGAGKPFFDAYANSRNVERSLPIVRNLNEWLAKDWRTEPYRKVCNEVCPNHPDDCWYPAFIANSAMFGMFYLHSPSEIIVPQRQFAASNRAAGTLWRNLRDQLSYFPDWVGSSLAHNGAPQCLVIALSDGGLPWDRD